MAKYGVVAGDVATRVMKSMIEGFNDMEVTYTPETMENMIRELTSTGGLQLQELKAIIIMDYAFDYGLEGDVNKVAEDFVAIQDLMRSNRLENVTLYLVTKHTDLYEKLKGNVAGVPGIYFENVQVLLTKEDYKGAFLRSILLGELDNKGLYNKDVVKRKSRKDRLEEERSIEIESRRNLREELVKFEHHEPVSVISEMDYVDSPRRKAAEEKKKKEEELARRKQEREKSKNKNRPVEEDTGPDVKVNIYTDGSGLVEPVQGGKEELSGYLDDNLKESFNDIKNVRTDVARGKIESDSGIIAVVGDYNSGASGVVANAAEMYTMAKRKVLIIDLDIQNRMQTLYFNQYDKVVENQRGASDSLIEVIQGYSMEDSVVPITKWLHILSVGRDEEVSLDWVSAIAGSIEAVLLEARRLYDVIILDIPFRFFRNYINVFDKVDKNIFVVENKFYKVENFLENVIHPILLEDTERVEEIIKKSNLILNKFQRGMMDPDGREINRRYMRKILDGIGYPYDNIGVAGEIPHYSDWEEQYFTGLRHVWKDKVSLGVYRRVFGKVVI